MSKISSSVKNETVLLEEYVSLLKKAGASISPEVSLSSLISVNASEVSLDSILFVVDVQNDFLPPNGTFAVSEGLSILPTIEEKYLNDLFLNSHPDGAFHKNIVYCTRDYHPIDHCSFNTTKTTVTVSDGSIMKDNKIITTIGPFPPHCVQGSKGSEFHESIVKGIIKREEKIKKDKKFNSDKMMEPTSYYGGIYKEKADDNNINTISYPTTGIVFKGFCNAIDSYSAFPYQDEVVKDCVNAAIAKANNFNNDKCEIIAKGRLTCSPFIVNNKNNSNNSNIDELISPNQYCSSAWTGGFLLGCSSLCYNNHAYDGDDKNDIINFNPNTAPDVMAVLMHKKTLSDEIKDLIMSRNVNKEKKLLKNSAEMELKIRRPNAFVCGLALDFCVIDTALNAARSGLFNSVYLILSATRAAHIKHDDKTDKSGFFGTGFITDPVIFVNRIKEVNENAYNNNGVEKDVIIIDTTYNKDDNKNIDFRKYPCAVHLIMNVTA